MKNSKQITVLKIGGEVTSHPTIFKAISKEIATFKNKNMASVLIHGGGPQVNDMEKKLGRKIEFINGRRVTSKDALETIKMVIAGKLNIDIVTAFKTHQISAIGLSGVDGTLLNVKRRLPNNNIDYGYAGDIISVNHSLLSLLIENEYFPVIAPLGADENGEIYNINADTVASAISASLNANELIMITNVDGVYDNQRKIISHLTYKNALDLIETGIINGGMIPKIESALSAIDSGVNKIRIVNGLKIAENPQFLFDHLIGTTITEDL